MNFVLNLSNEFCLIYFEAIYRGEETGVSIGLQHQ